MVFADQVNGSDGGLDFVNPFLNVFFVLILGFFQVVYLLQHGFAGCAKRLLEKLFGTGLRFIQHLADKIFLVQQV